MAQATFPVTGDPDMDELLVSDPFALVLGLMLDQQIPMEKAFAGPYVLRERLGGTLDPATIVAQDPDRFDALFAQKPALHRFPGAMAERARKLAATIVDDYEGDTASIWTTASDAQDLFDRIRALPGFGDGKARIFVALLAKRFGVRPAGWEHIAGELADGQPRSLADIDSPAAFEAVRAHKKQLKASAKTSR